MGAALSDGGGRMWPIGAPVAHPCIRRRRRRIPQSDVSSSVGLVGFLHLHELKVVAPVRGQLTRQSQLLHQVHKLMGVAFIREQLCNKGKCWMLFS